MSDRAPSRFTGGCACAAVRYESAAAPLAMVNCHSRDCQRAGGAGFSPTVVVSRAALRLSSGEPREYRVVAASGNIAHRAFCAECGSPLYAWSSARPEVVGIRAASLDDPTWFRPSADLWTASAQPWDVMSSSVERFSRDRSRG